MRLEQATLPLDWDVLLFCGQFVYWNPYEADWQQERPAAMNAAMEAKVLWEEGGWLGPSKCEAQRPRLIYIRRQCET